MALEALHELAMEPSTSEWSDEIVYVTAKTEELTKDGRIPIDDPIESITSLKDAVKRALCATNDFEPDISFEQLLKDLCDRRVLLCIDNLETLLRDYADAFDEFYSETPQAWRLVVTSRVPVNSATVVSLDAMQVGPATHLARQYLSRRGGTPLETESLTEIAKRADCNPLAIRICIDGLLLGVELSTALSNARSHLLIYSYENLIQMLPSSANHILECLFAVAERQSRPELCRLLDLSVDDVAIGLQALLRTSLVLRHTETASESYSLSVSVRDLLLGNPLDESVRSSVVRRIDERNSALAALKSSNQRDALDRDFISSDAPDHIREIAYETFRAIKRNAPKSDLVNVLTDLRRDLAAGQPQSLLYRLASVLCYELNDRASMRQFLQDAERVGALDDAGRLLLAEELLNQMAYEDCVNIVKPLLEQSLLAEGKTSRFNLMRLARVKWLPRIRLGEALRVASETSDWENYSELKVSKSIIHITALRKLISNERSESQFNEYVTQLTQCLDNIIKSEGYLGFLVNEAYECLESIVSHVGRTSLSETSATHFGEFIDSHFNGICTVHRELTPGEGRSNDLLNKARVITLPFGKELLSASTGQPLAEDQRLAEVGYVAAEIYHWPTDEIGHRKTFCFAKDNDGEEYYVSQRSMSEAYDMFKLSVGKRLYVLPRADIDEGKAIAVRDAIPMME